MLHINLPADGLPERAEVKMNHFVVGGAGFLGRVLVRKLHRSLSRAVDNLDNIYEIARKFL